MMEPIRQGDIPGVQLRCRQELAIPVTEAWSWLTQPDRLGQWLAARVIAEPGVAQGLRIETDDEDRGRLREEGATLELEPGRRWVLAFRQLEAGWPVATRLTFEISSVGDGSELSVLQQGFEHLPLSDCLTIWESYRRRWRQALSRLAGLAATG